MPLDPSNLIIGTFAVSINGTDMGLCTEEGISYKPEASVTEYMGGQTAVIVAAHRHRVRAIVAIEFSEITLENWQLFEGLENAPSGGELSGSYALYQDTVSLVLSLPGPNRTTRSFEATAIVLTPPEMIFNNKDYTGAPVEFLLLGDATNNDYWNIVESASSATAPVVDAVTSSAGTLADGATGIATSITYIELDYNVAIRQDFVNTESFMLKTSAGNDNITGLAVAYGATNDKIRLTWTGALSAATEYQILARKGIRSVSGVKQAALFGRQFTTA